MKKALVLGATTILTLGFSNGALSSIAHAANSDEHISPGITELQGDSIIEDSEKSILEVAPYVHKDDQGFLYVDSNIPQNIYVENHVEVLEESFKEINKQVEKGQVVVNDDLSIVTLSNNIHGDFTNKSNLRVSLAAASTKGYTSKTYWWGVRATYTNSQAKTAIKQLEDAAEHESTMSTVLFFLPPVNGIAGLTGLYCSKLGKAMKSSNKGNGVILDMTWALTYKVKSR